MKKLLLIDKVIAVINIIIAVISLVAFLSYFISPNTISLVSFIGLSIPFLLFFSSCKPVNDKPEIQNIIQIFNDAWSDNWGFVPLSDVEIHHMAKMLRLIVQPQNFAIAELDSLASMAEIAAAARFRVICKQCGYEKVCGFALRSCPRR